MSETKNEEASSKLEISEKPETEKQENLTTKSKSDKELYRKRSEVSSDEEYDRRKKRRDERYGDNYDKRRDYKSERKSRRSKSRSRSPYDKERSRSRRYDDEDDRRGDRRKGRRDYDDDKRDSRDSRRYSERSESDKRESSTSSRRERRSRSPSPESKRRQQEKEEFLREKEERRAKGLPTARPLPAKGVVQETPDEILKKLKVGGVYIPPFKLRRAQNTVQDKKSLEYQRLNWDTLKKSINGIINKVNVTNIKNIIPELFAENLVRGRGLFARAIMKAQAASPSFTHVYAALIAVVNTKMPEIGELVLKRLILGFRKAYQRNDKVKCIAFCKFIAHLVNQQVAHEVLAGQILQLLLERPTDDSVELAVGFVKECGQVLNNIAPKILHAVFERFRSVLHEGEIDKRVQYMIEALFTVRKKDFAEHPGVTPDLDLVEADEQITHEFELDDDINPEPQLDYFHYDAEFETNEQTYAEIKKEILGSDDEEEEEEEAGEGEEEEDNPDSHEVKVGEKPDDQTQADILTLKRTIYLTIFSSINYQETINKLLRNPQFQGKEMEVASMILETCSQDKMYQNYHGLMAQRLCQIDKKYQERFEECFRIQYAMIHRLETNKLRNVAKLFAHLLSTDAISWAVLESIQLNQNDTTSSSRIFIKVLFQELSEIMGLRKLNERLGDEYLKDHFAGLFPKTNLVDTKFAINFWTSVGLGALTDDLRQHLETASKLAAEMQKAKAAADDSDDDSSSSSSSSSDSSDSDSSDDERSKRRRKK